MTEAMWIVSALGGLAVGLILLILNDHRGHQKDTEGRMDKLEDEVKRQDIESTRIRMDGFSRLSAIEESFNAIKDAITEFRIENRQRQDRTDGRLDRLESKLDKLNGRH